MSQKRGNLLRLENKCVIWRVWPFQAYLQTFLRYTRGGNFTPAGSQMQFICSWCKNNELLLLSSSGRLVSLAGNQAAVRGFGSHRFSRLENRRRCFGLLEDLSVLRSVTTTSGPEKLYWGRRVTIFSHFYYKHLQLRVLFLQQWTIRFAEVADLILEQTSNKLYVSKILCFFYCSADSLYSHTFVPSRRLREDLLYTGTSFWGNNPDENWWDCIVLIISAALSPRIKKKLPQGDNKVYRIVSEVTGSEGDAAVVAVVLLCAAVGAVGEHLWPEVSSPFTPPSHPLQQPGQPSALYIRL